MTITAQAAIAAINEALAKGPTPGLWRCDGWRVEIMKSGFPAIALCGYSNEIEERDMA